jgi:putative acetyltransferase
MMDAMIAPTFTIRDENPADRDRVRAVNQLAFDGDVEADLVRVLYAAGEVLFGLVAEADGRLVGHILFSRLPIAMATGEVIPAAALAPLAVLPDWQRQGIGSALVRQGLARCQERDVPAVVVLGDPAYYTRFGFYVETARGLQTPWSGPHLMAIELTPGCLGDGQGVAHYPAAFMALGG